MSAVPAMIRLRDAIALARARNASDLHLDAGMPPVLRIDGSLETTPESAFTADDLSQVARSIVRAEETPAGGDVTVTWRDAELGSLRAHVYRGSRGPAIALRLLANGVPALESLHLPDVLGRVCERPVGLVIVAGPTGSGKSTTLAALVDRINAQRACRIVTIEEPIEYEHSSRRAVITQREVGRDTPHLDAALHGVLRADPDVIVVGEVRDGASIRGVLTAAETGHQVLTTLHTADAAQTIGRIVDAFAGSEQAQVRTQLAQVLACVICQRLVRRGNGRGRRAVAEVLVGTDAVLSMIRESRAHQIRNAIATGRSHGMQTFEQHAQELVREREIDPDEARLLFETRS